jgi:hypothetical protein
LLDGGQPAMACMYKGWAIKSNPCIATFNDLLCFGNSMSAEAEESQLLKAITREQLVKTQQSEKT